MKRKQRFVASQRGNLLRRIFGFQKDAKLLVLEDDSEPRVEYNRLKVGKLWLKARIPTQYARRRLTGDKEITEADEQEFRSRHWLLAYESVCARKENDRSLDAAEDERWYA